MQRRRDTALSSPQSNDLRRRRPDDSQTPKSNHCQAQATDGRDVGYQDN
jgi:hypothetical protein